MFNTEQEITLEIAYANMLHEQVHTSGSVMTFFNRLTAEI